MYTMYRYVEDMDEEDMDEIGEGGKQAEPPTVHYIIFILTIKL